MISSAERSGQTSLPRRQALSLAGRRLTLALPVAAITLYGAALASRAVELSSATFLNADPPAAAYQAIALSGGATLALHTEIAPTLVEGALVGLPGGHLMIQLLGPLLALVTICVMCWAVRRLGGAWLAAAVAGGAAGPILLWSVLFPTAHVVSFLTAALLAYTLSAIALGRATGRLLASSGVAAGIALVGDQGFLAIGIMPMLTAGAALWLVRHNRKDLRAIGGILATAATVTLAGELLLHAFGVRFVGDALFGSVGIGRVPVSTGIVAAIRTLGAMVGGQWGDSLLPQPLESLALMTGLAVPLVAPIALVQRLRSRRITDAGRVAYLVFWTAADLLVLAVYIVFGYANNAWSAHYLLPCFLSAVATLPFVAPAHVPSLPRLAAATVALVAAVGILLVPAVDFSGLHPPTDGQRVVAALRASGLTRGYADYWESHSLTWLSGETVHVYPVGVLGCTATANLCRYQYSASTWYAPVAGPTFLILRHSWPCVSTAPTSVLGQPDQTMIINADTTILVYHYDIATRFASPLIPGCGN